MLEIGKLTWTCGSSIDYCNGYEPQFQAVDQWTTHGRLQMIEIEASIQHCLGQQEAVSRIHQLVASLSQRFPQQVHQVQLHLKDHWVDVSFAAYGYVVSWRAEVYDDQVALLGRIPDSAKKFKNKIEQAILARVEETLVLPPLRKAG